MNDSNSDNSLFNGMDIDFNAKPTSLYTSKIKIKHRKHSEKHWDCYRRLKHLSNVYRIAHGIKKSKKNTWRIAYKLAKIGYRYMNLRGQTDSEYNLEMAVKAMRSYWIQPYNARKRSRQSVNKIANDYGISKPTLYRKYYQEYGNTVIFNNGRIIGHL